MMIPESKGRKSDASLLVRIFAFEIHKVTVQGLSELLPRKNNTHSQK
jgi:hypothetical protein